jgi:hypothetical protein
MTVETFQRDRQIKTMKLRVNNPHNLQKFYGSRKTCYIDIQDGTAKTASEQTRHPEYWTFL